MNRRGFFASLFVLPAAVKAVVTQPAPLDLDEIFSRFDALKKSRGPEALRTAWFQTSRKSIYVSDEYRAIVEAAISPGEFTYRRALHRNRIARLEAEPKPNLP